MGKRLFNADYSYADKYFLSANLASDASSRFGKNVSNGINISSNVFSVLPSVAAAWLISGEKAMADSKIDC